MQDVLASKHGGQLLRHDVEAKSKTYYHQDPATGEVGIEEVSDVTDVIEDNQAQFNRFDERSKWRHNGRMNHVARIPLDIYYSIEFQKVARDPIALKKWLNDYFNRKHRTRPGRL